MKNLLPGFVVLFSSALAFGQSQSSSAQRATNAATEQASERLAADTPKTTVLGNAFVAPKDWSIRIKGPVTILTAPEGDSWIAFADVQATGPDEALAAAWQAYKPDAKWPVKVTHDLPDKDGWIQRRVYEYLTSPNEKRGVAALVSYSGSNWTVVIEDLADAVAGKRGAQGALILGRLLPKGYSRESFAGKKANALDQARIAELIRFIESGLKVSGVPGVAFGVVQDGKVVFADGFGTKELGSSDKPDADTLFMVASNTKINTQYCLRTQNNAVTPNATAYQQLYAWTVGAVASGPCSATGTVWSCGLTRSNNYQALAVWDVSRACLNCNTGTYDVPVQFKRYRDLG